MRGFINVRRFVFVVGLALISSCAFGQSVNYLSVDIVAGVKTQIGFNSLFGKNCEPVRLTPVNVIVAPKHGFLQIRDGVVTGKDNSRCASQKTPAQIIFYEPKADYAGGDEIIFEASNPAGITTRYQINVTVKERPAKIAPQAPGQSL